MSAGWEDQQAGSSAFPALGSPQYSPGWTHPGGRSSAAVPDQPWSKDWLLERINGIVRLPWSWSRQRHHQCPSQSGRAFWAWWGWSHPSFHQETPSCIPASSFHLARVEGEWSLSWASHWERSWWRLLTLTLTETGWWYLQKASFSPFFLLLLSDLQKIKGRKLRLSKSKWELSEGMWRQNRTILFGFHSIFNLRRSGSVSIQLLFIQCGSRQLIYAMLYYVGGWI